MKSKTVFILALLCTVVQGAWAEELTKKQALELAKQFVASHISAPNNGNAARSNIRQAAPTINEAGQVSGLYVFNVSDDGGFVIVSNDDRTVPILGFGQKGNIYPDNIPDNMRAWLQGYADQIEWLKTVQGSKVQGSKVQGSKNKAAEPSAKVQGAKPDIEPLLKSKWNQNKPYNNLCPEIDGEKTVTGCTATALAQIMRYHEWPKEACTAIPGYTCETQNKAKETISLTVDGLPATTFDWENMIDIYSIRDPEDKNKYEYFGNETQQHAVSELMRYCSTALCTGYGLNENGGSGASDITIPYLLRTYFGYDGGIEYCLRPMHPYQEWVDMIYSELAESRPVLYGGASAGGGHAFVCDGYKFKDDADYFSINWGWSGISDNYFLLSLLNPTEQGVGGSSSLDGFSFYQDAIIGIQPPVEGNKDYGLFMDFLCLDEENHRLTSKTFSRESSTDDFTDINIFFSVSCYDPVPMDYEIALQLVDEGGNVVKTFETFNESMGWDKFSEKSVSVTIPPTVGDGTYYIKVVCRPAGSEEWQECHHGSQLQLTAEISGNTLTIGVPFPMDIFPEVTLSVTGDLKKGHEQTVTATISDGIYNGDIVLFVNDKVIMGQELNLKAGETVELQFSFIPNKAGENTLALYSSNYDDKIQIGSSTTVEITEDATGIQAVLEQVKRQSRASGERSAVSEAGAWFDLMGRQISGEPTAAGVYIVKVGNRPVQKISISK